MPARRPRKGGASPPPITFSGVISACYLGQSIGRRRPPGCSPVARSPRCELPVRTRCLSAHPAIRIDFFHVGPCDGDRPSAGGVRRARISHQVPSRGGARCRECADLGPKIRGGVLAVRRAGRREKAVHLRRAALPQQEHCDSSGLGFVPFPRKRRREGFSADPGFVSRIVDVDVDLDVNVNVNLVDSGVDAS